MHGLSVGTRIQYPILHSDLGEFGARVIQTPRTMTSVDGRAAKRQRFSPSAPDYVKPEDNGVDDEKSRPGTARAAPGILATLEPCILNAEPFDEVMREVADWIYEMAMGHEHVEVEAKIGLLIDTGTGQRLSFPIRTETSAFLRAIPVIFRLMCASQSSSPAMIASDSSPICPRCVRTIFHAPHHSS